MIDAFSTPHDKKLTLILLAICGLLAIAAIVAGIEDNLPGILLAFLAATAFVLAFVHPWRIAKKYLFLLLASVLGFILYQMFRKAPCFSSGDVRNGFACSIHRLTVY